MKQAVIQYVTDPKSGDVLIAGWRDVAMVKDLPDDYLSMKPVMFSDFDESGRKAVFVMNDATIKEEASKIEVHLSGYELHGGDVLSAEDWKKVSDMVLKAGENLHTALTKGENHEKPERVTEQPRVFAFRV